MPELNFSQDILSSEGEAMMLSEGLVYEHNFQNCFSIEDGFVVWPTDGMIQRIFEQGR